MIKTRSGTPVAVLERTDHPGWVVVRYMDAAGFERVREMALSELETTGAMQDVAAALAALPNPVTQRRPLLALSDGEHYMLSRIACGKERPIQQFRRARKATASRLQRRGMLIIAGNGRLTLTEFGARVLGAWAALSALAAEEAEYLQSGSTSDESLASAFVAGHNKR